MLRGGGSVGSGKGRVGGCGRGESGAVPSGGLVGRGAVRGRRVHLRLRLRGRLRPAPGSTHDLSRIAQLRRRISLLRRYKSRKSSRPPISHPTPVDRNESIDFDTGLVL